MGALVVLVLVKSLFQFLHAIFEVFDPLFVVSMFMWMFMIVGVCHPVPPSGRSILACAVSTANLFL